MWFENKGEVLAFLRARNEAESLTFENVIYFLEKPWKWDDEYEAWIRAGRPPKAPELEAAGV